MDGTSASVHNNIGYEGDGCIVRNVQVCKPEDDNIEDPYNVNVKQEPIEAESYDDRHAVPYVDGDNYDDTSSNSMAGIVKQEPAEEGTEGEVRYAVRYQEIDIVYEPDEPTKQPEIEYARVKSERSTDPVVTSSSNYNKQVLLPECSKQSSNDHTVTLNEGYSDRQVVGNDISTKILSDMPISQQRHRASFECDVCMKPFSHKKYLNRHKRIHTGEKPFECDICEKKFGDGSSFVKHKRTHSGEKPYECDICLKKFTAAPSLKHHKYIHTGERPYACDMCPKTFTEPSHFRSHKRTHTGEKRHECDVCMKRFSEGSSLSKHKRIHSGEKPFECDICMKKFSDRSNLINHRLIHSEEKAFECYICMKKFSNLWNYNSHKLIHTGETPFECDVCMKKFNKSSVLKKHKRIHTGEKPYECNVCMKKFTQGSSLNRHKKTHIADELSSMNPEMITYEVPVTGPQASAHFVDDAGVIPNISQVIIAPEDD